MFSFPSDFSSEASCDSSNSKQIADVTYAALSDGRYVGFTTTSSYMDLRSLSMQAATGFIQFNRATNAWRCARSTELYGSIACPEGFEKKPRSQVETGCSDAGLECQPGYQCVYSPCFETVECIDSVEIVGSCIEYSVLLSSILVPLGRFSMGVCLSVWSRKSRQLVKQAKESAAKERELNEYLPSVVQSAPCFRHLHSLTTSLTSCRHEVRNPLSAALSAATFVTNTIQSICPIDEGARKDVAENLNVIDCSLRFINDLLRSTLDLNRASRRLVTLSQESAGILHDILVASPVYNRDTNFEILLECPQCLVVQTDNSA